MKRAPHCAEPVGFLSYCSGLAGDYVGRTRAFSALSDLELDLLALIKIGIAGRLDFRVVDEQIFAATIGADKSKTFCPIKPFYCTYTHNSAPLAFKWP